MILREFIRKAHSQACFLALFSFLFQACATPVWQRADIAKRRGDAGKAAQEIESHLQKNPRDANAYYLLAEMRAEMRDWAGCIEAFTRCEELNSRLRRDVRQRKEYYWKKNIHNGLDHLKGGQYEQGVDYFIAATTIYPSRALGHRLLGETYVQIADSLQSREDHFFKSGDSSRTVHFSSLASAAVHEARGAFENALNHDFKDERARRFLMKIYFETGAYQEAIRESDTMLRLKSNDREAMRIRAYTYDILDDVEEATKAYRALIEREPLPADLESYAAFKYRHSAYNDAVVLSKKAIQAGGELMGNREAVAQSRLMQQNSPQLFAAANAILAEENWHVNALMLRQAAEISLGQLAAADRTAYKYLKAVAQARLMARKYPELLKSANDLLAADSANVHALRLRYIALDSLGRKEAFTAKIRFHYAYTDSLRGEKNFLGMVEITNEILAMDSTNRRAANEQMMAFDSLAQPEMANQTQIKFWLAIAGEAFGDRAFDKTLTEVDSILMLDKSDIRALRLRYVSYDSLGQDQQALEAESAYLNALAGDNFKKQDYLERLRLANNMLMLNRTNRDAVNIKIDALMALNRKREATQARIDFLFAYSDSLKRAKAYPELLKTADDILIIDRRHIQGLKLRMDAYDFLKHEAQARSAEVDYRLAISDSLYRINDHEGILAIADRILEIDETHLRALEMRFRMLVSLGQPREALAAELKYLLRVSEGHEREKKFRELIKTTSRILEIDRTNKTATDKKIIAHKAIGQINQAQQTQIDYWFAMAEAHFKSKQYKIVHEFVDKILSTDPNHLDALKMKRAAYLSRGFTEKALALKQKIETLEKKK